VVEVAEKTGMEHSSMTKVFKWLGGSVAGVLGGVLLLAASGGLNATDVAAQSPPSPPARFVGSVIVDGQPAAAGTVIEARVGSTTCGSDSVFMQGSEARYQVDVAALDPAGNPNCGTEGAVVTFYIGGKLADQSGTWRSFDINIVNLTYTTPTPVPSVTVTASPSVTVTGTATTPGTGTTATPRPPSTGMGTEAAAGDGPAVWLFVLLGTGALAFGVGGATVARRNK
jgi:hypothetical protein